MEFFNFEVTMPKITRVVSSRLPTDFGDFILTLYILPGDEKEHLILSKGDLKGKKDVLVRVHSECFTGDVLSSRRCDCGEQLQNSMKRIQEEGQGAVIYLRQEGRGIGLSEKLKAYNLQDQGMDTVEANLALGHPADGRDYSIAADILRDMGIQSVKILTNNPAKMEDLKKLGIEVSERIPLTGQVHKENISYLKTKVDRMNHILDLTDWDLPQPITSGV